MHVEVLGISKTYTICHKNNKRVVVISLEFFLSTLTRI